MTELYKHLVVLIKFPFKNIFNAIVIRFGACVLWYLLIAFLATVLAILSGWCNSPAKMVFGYLEIFLLMFDVISIIYLTLNDFLTIHKQDIRNNECDLIFHSVISTGAAIIVIISSCVMHVILQYVALITMTKDLHDTSLDYILDMLYFSEYYILCYGVILIASSVLCIISGMISHKMEA